MSSESAALAHEIEACFYNGEYWTVICSCMWEGWNMPTERAARAIHADHVFDPEADFPRVRTFQ